MRRALLVFAFSSVCYAQDAAPYNRQWTYSAAFLASSTVADSFSSYGRIELNPVLGQRFDARSVAIKGGIVGGLIVTERLMPAKYRKAFTWANYAVGGVTWGVAGRNWRLK